MGILVDLREGEEEEVMSKQQPICPSFNVSTPAQERADIRDGRFPSTVTTRRGHTRFLFLIEQLDQKRSQCLLRAQARFENVFAIYQSLLSDSDIPYRQKSFSHCQW